MSDPYKAALAKYLERLAALPAIRERERMAGEVFEMVNAIYTHADKPDPAELQRFGAKILGAYAYLAVRATRLEAEADLAEGAADAARAGLVTAYSANADTNVTRARSLADAATAEDRADARIRKLQADEMEAVAKIADKTLILILSMLRQFESERKAQGRMAP